MSEWILLGNTAVRQAVASPPPRMQADVCKIEMQMSGPISYMVTLRSGERLSVREEQAGGKWLYLRLKEATESGWTASEAVLD